MPLAGKHTDIGVYPQEYGYAIGYPALPSSTTAALTEEQYESVSQGDISVTVSPALMTGSRGYTQRQVTWQSQYSSTPSGPGIDLEGSIDNENWTVVDTTSNTGGESRTVASNYQKFRINVRALGGAIGAIFKIAFM